MKTAKQGTWTVRRCQNEVNKHLKKVGYFKVEKSVLHAFPHLIEEVGEFARALSHRETTRASLRAVREPGDLADELADIFWQVLKIAIYLDLDLQSSFIRKFRKNQCKGE